MYLLDYGNADCNKAVMFHYIIFTTGLDVATKELVAIRNLKNLNRLLASHSYCSPISLALSC